MFRTITPVTQSQNKIVTFCPTSLSQWLSLKNCLLVGCLTSQQHASVSQGRTCSDNFTCQSQETVVAFCPILLSWWLNLKRRLGPSVLYCHPDDSIWREDWDLLSLTVIPMTQSEETIGTFCSILSSWWLNLKRRLGPSVPYCYPDDSIWREDWDLLSFTVILMTQSEAKIGTFCPILLSWWLNVKRGFWPSVLYCYPGDSIWRENWDLLSLTVILVIQSEEKYATFCPILLSWWFNLKRKLGPSVLYCYPGDSIWREVCDLLSYTVILVIQSEEKIGTFCPLLLSWWLNLKRRLGPSVLYCYPDDSIWREDWDLLSFTVILMTQSEAKIGTFCPILLSWWLNIKRGLWPSVLYCYPGDSIWREDWDLLSYTVILVIQSEEKIGTFCPLLLSWWLNPKRRLGPSVLYCYPGDSIWREDWDLLSYTVILVIQSEEKIGTFCPMLLSWWFNLKRGLWPCVLCCYPDDSIWREKCDPLSYTVILVTQSEERIETFCPILLSWRLSLKRRLGPSVLYCYPGGSISREDCGLLFYTVILVTQSLWNIVVFCPTLVCWWLNLKMTLWPSVLCCYPGDSNSWRHCSLLSYTAGVALTRKKCVFYAKKVGYANLKMPCVYCTQKKWPHTSKCV